MLIKDKNKSIIFLIFFLIFNLNVSAEEFDIKEGSPEYRVYIKRVDNNEELGAVLFVKYFDLKPGISINGYSRWGILAHSANLSTNNYWYMVGTNESNVT